MGEHEIEEMWRKQHGISKGSKNQFRVTIVNPAEKIITGDTPYVWGNSLNDGFQLANNLLKDKVLSGLPTKKPLVIEIEEKQGKKRSWHITLEIKRGKWKGVTFLSNLNNDIFETMERLVPKTRGKQ